MLDYVKTILQKVSFDTSLFRKELQKSINWLTSKEKGELKVWLNYSFNGDHKKIIKDIFDKNVA